LRGNISMVHAWSSVRPKLQALLLPVGTIGMRSIMHRGGRGGQRRGQTRWWHDERYACDFLLRTRKRKSRAARVACKLIARYARAMHCCAPPPPRSRGDRKYRATTWRILSPSSVVREEEGGNLRHYNANEVSLAGCFARIIRAQEEEEEERRSHLRATRYVKRNAKSAATCFDSSKSERKRDRGSSSPPTLISVPLISSKCCPKNKR